MRIRNASDYLEPAIARLTAAESYSYAPTGQWRTEPVAWSAMALVVHGQLDRARQLLDWLAQTQAPDGSLGIDRTASEPGWPTGLAVLAWSLASDRLPETECFAPERQRAVRWLLATRGMLVEQGQQLGHDSTLRGWPWVVGTHSWLEPTAINLLALKHAGHGDHPRAREAVRLLQNRILPQGGCNYGNTVVFDQELRPHVEPTGLCLLALGGERDVAECLGSSVAYLERELSERTTTASLCFGLLGLAAQDHDPPAAQEFLAAAAQRTLARDGSAYKLALLALAAQGRDCPLVQARRTTTASRS